jgi:predicted nuclease of restriction endonuclease-like (RecB) superfamily
MSRDTPKRTPRRASTPPGYDDLVAELYSLVEHVRRQAARSVNSIMTATYWFIGRRIVEQEQKGKRRAKYGETLIKGLSKDLGERLGRGFGERNLRHMRAFYQSRPTVLESLARELDAGDESQIWQTLSAKLANLSSPTNWQTLSAESPQDVVLLLAQRFPLPWSHYLKLLSVQDEDAREFYEAEALRGGWSVRQLDRQISSQFYQRTLLSKNKAAMIRRGRKPRASDLVTANEEVKDPFILEFLDLKDEYSESDLEAALIAQLVTFLLELGGDFAFIGRQRRLRVGDEWYRVDLVFFHRRLRCLVVIDLKVGKFTHADAGQMHLYLNYAREHWMVPDENPPVGIILCAQKNDAVVHYALEGLPNQVLAAQYQTVLPDEEILKDELKRTRRQLERSRNPK